MTQLRIILKVYFTEKCSLKDYWGSRRRTVNGYVCQRWDVQKPYNHSFTAKDFGVDVLWEISNFCRNPDSSLDGPWCFVTNGPMIREPCFDHCTGEQYKQQCGRQCIKIGNVLECVLSLF